MSKVTINGVDYVPANETGEIKIVVLERGFIYIGRVAESGDVMTIRSARNIIKWGTSNHLGEIVNGPLENTKLGTSCTVNCRQNQVIHTIEVNQNEWNKYID